MNVKLVFSFEYDSMTQSSVEPLGGGDGWRGVHVYGSGRLAVDRNVEELVVLGEVEFAIGCRDRLYPNRGSVVEVADRSWAWDSRDLCERRSRSGLHDVEERASGSGSPPGPVVDSGGGETGDLRRPAPDR